MLQKFSMQLWINYQCKLEMGRLPVHTHLSSIRWRKFSECHGGSDVRPQTRGIISTIKNQACKMLPVWNYHHEFPWNSLQILNIPSQNSLKTNNWCLTNIHLPFWHDCNGISHWKSTNFRTSSYIGPSGDHGTWPLYTCVWVKKIRFRGGEKSHMGNSLRDKMSYIFWRGLK